MRFLRTLALALLAFALAIPAAQSARAGDKKAEAKNKPVAADLVAGEAPKPDDPAWKDWVHRDCDISEFTKLGDVWITVIVKAGNTARDRTAMQLKITRGPDQTVTRKENGRNVNKVVPGKPEMKALTTVEQPVESNVRPGYEFRYRWADGPMDGLKESGKASLAFWVQTTNPEASGDAHNPILGCIELWVSKDGNQKVLRFWRYQPKVEATMSPPADGQAPAAIPPSPKAPEAARQPDPPEQEEPDSGE